MVTPIIIRLAILALSLPVLALASTFVSPGRAQAAGTTIECSIPLEVVCDISNPSGIAAVKVVVDFGDLGKIAVVDQQYPSCPTHVQVSWDPIVPNADIQVTPCDKAGGLTLGGHDGYGDDSLHLGPSDFRRMRVASLPFSLQLQVLRFGLAQ